MRKRRIHAWPVRLTHWLNAVAMLAMFMSGWGIYNASPLFGFRFNQELTLGGWLGGSIAWHLAVMWVIFGNALLYGLYGLFSGHFKRDFLPINARALGTDLKAALRLRLSHTLGHYNAVQRLLYWGVLALGALLVISGLAIWKPVQLQLLTGALGGYDTARYVHFFAMAGVGLFVIVHLVLVIMVPRTLLPMITGGRMSEPAPASRDSRHD